MSTPTQNVLSIPLRMKLEYGRYTHRTRKRILSIPLRMKQSFRPQKQQEQVVNFQFP